jgi:hypothetical protein
MKPGMVLLSNNEPDELWFIQSSGAWIRTKDLQVMSKAPGPQTLLLQVTHFSLARRWTIQTSQAIDGFDLMTVFEHEFHLDRRDLVVAFTATGCAYISHLHRDTVL